MTFPMQTIEIAEDGVPRFRENRIVRLLLDSGKITLNDLALMPFELWEHEQLAQLIGYSTSGFGELSYASEEMVTDADAIAEGLLKAPAPEGHCKSCKRKMTVTADPRWPEALDCGGDCLGCVKGHEE